jgi:DNA-binding transcriptional MerR regulator
MNVESYDIQELIDRSGVPRRNIYFYVQQGLLPPPAGAGLAARYGSEHLLRLRLIPLLRGQGLRLDQIRQRFDALSTAEMESMLALPQLPHPSQPVPVVQRPPVLPQPLPRPPAGQACTRYDLPGGIVLIIPAGLRSEYRLLSEHLIHVIERDLKDLS